MSPRHNIPKKYHRFHREITCKINDLKKTYPNALIKLAKFDTYDENPEAESDKKFQIIVAAIKNDIALGAQVYEFSAEETVDFLLSLKY